MPEAVQNLPKEIIKGIVLTALFSVIAMHLPPMAVLLPLPMVYYRLKLGRKHGGLVLLTGVAGINMWLQALSIDALFFSYLLTLGFVLSECVKMNLSAEKTILYTSVGMLFAGVVFALFASRVAGAGIVDMASDNVNKLIEMTIALYKETGVPEENILFVSSNQEKIQYVWVRIIPAIAASGTLVVAWITLLLSRAFFPRRGILFPDYGHLNQWKTPDTLVWGVIGCGILLFLPITGLRLIGLNGMIVLTVVYFFQGIAIVSFFFEKKGVPRLPQALFYVMIAMQMMLWPILSIVGFSDIWLNLRKLGTNMETV